MRRRARCEGEKQNTKVKHMYDPLPSGGAQLAIKISIRKKRPAGLRKKKIGSFTDGLWTSLPSPSQSGQNTQNLCLCNLCRMDRDLGSRGSRTRGHRQPAIGRIGYSLLCFGARGLARDDQGAPASVGFISPFCIPGSGWREHIRY